MIVDTRFLESLIAVVESGSIAGAARQQGLTSAAVSQRIIALERELDCVLLSRSAHVAKPTESCLNIVKQARKIVRDIEELKSDVTSTILTGNIRIGSISTALTGVLPPALRRLTDIAPNVLPIITPGTSKALYEAMQADTLDAAILVDPPFSIPKNLLKFIIQDEPLAFISKKKSNKSIKELLTEHAYIGYDSQSWGGRHAVSFLSDHGIHPNLFCELDALETICILVSQNIGVSLVPNWVGIENHSHHLTTIKINEEKYNRKIILLISSHTHRPKIINALMDALHIKP